MPQPEDLPDYLGEDIMTDFLTEANELIEQLDQDMVTLENEDNNLDLLNQIFRAIHTIKGSASFLSLDGLTQLAHLTEDVLNLSRKEQLKITSKVMDTLLNSIDVLRQQLGDLQQTGACSAAPDELLDQLRQLACVDEPESTEQNVSTTTPENHDAQETSQSNATNASGEEAVLALTASKRDLLPFMVEDMNDSLSQLQELIQQAQVTDNHTGIGVQMADITEGLLRSVDFYEVSVITEDVRILDQFAKHLAQLSDTHFGQALPRVCGLIHVLLQRAEALGQERIASLNTKTLCERLMMLCEGTDLPPEAILPALASVEVVLTCDGVIEPSKPAASEDTNNKTTEATTKSSGDRRTTTSDRRDAAGDRRASGNAGGNAGGASGGGTIRVDVARLESLLNLVGELVLQKNRVHSLARRVKGLNVDAALSEEAGEIASDLDRVTSDLQTGVMKTRMQAMNKLFGRYPRVIRDLAKATDKKIHLNIEGGNTEVDKTVLEGLTDPLVHLLRNCADHGLEMPDERVAAGKDETGVVTIGARHEGDHVVIEIKDDGRGLDTQKIGRKAIERGMVNEEELAAMSEAAICRLIFAPGFSMAVKVSDLSGRGVGMDVVHSNINQLGGTVDVKSKLGTGTTVAIKIPLTVAIMPAMMVNVSQETYAVPLSNLLEIVRPSEKDIYSIGGDPVMRLRDDVLPLVDLNQHFGHTTATASQSPFALVVKRGETTVGLMVEELIGQQEIVVKPLDDMFDQSKAISGATVREDGGVSLILDVAALVKSVEQTDLRPTPGPTPGLTPDSIPQAA